MDKTEKEYLEKYGHVPRDFSDRISHLIFELKLKKNHIEYIFNEVVRINRIKWKTESFIIYLEPKATPRPRSGFGGRVFYVKGASDNRKRFAKFMMNQDIDIIHTPMIFECNMYFPVPNAMSKPEKVLAELGFIRHITKPDWDNVGKSYSDMIQEQLILDDSLIIESRVKKFYSAKPRIEITIKYMEEHDSKFNDNKIKKILEKRK